MHLYAIDEKDNFLSAYQAEKQVDYRCPECKEIVRCRGGFLRQTHFYHLKPNRRCRQSGKTIIHLQTQQFLQKIITDSQLEKLFNPINRIADVAWDKEKIIFEIQCSPITAREIEERNRDYQSLGYQVIWILHDRLYNKQRLTAAEYFLQEYPHYFTNMNAEGVGFVYDQWDIVEKGRRLKTMEPRQVQLSSFKSCYPTLFSKKDYPKWMLKRIQTWPLLFTGDYLEHFLSLEEIEKIEFLNEAVNKENIVLSQEGEKPPTTPGLLKKLRRVANFMTFPYRLTLHLILEKLSR